MLSAMLFVLSGLAWKGCRWVSLGPLIRCCNEDLVSCQARCLIELRIFRCWTLPRKILGHAVKLDALPDAFVGEMMQSQANGIEQSRASIGLKLEAGAGAVLYVKRFDSVVEAAGGAHDGDGPILQTVNLI